jgi:hypothetical protein
VIATANAMFKAEAPKILNVRVLIGFSFRVVTAGRQDDAHFD